MKKVNWIQTRWIFQKSMKTQLSPLFLCHIYLQQSLEVTWGYLTRPVRCSTCSTCSKHLHPTPRRKAESLHRRYASSHRARRHLIPLITALGQRITTTALFIFPQGRPTNRVNTLPVISTCYLQFGMYECREQTVMTYWAYKTPYRDYHVFSEWGTGH